LRNIILHKVCKKKNGLVIFDNISLKIPSGEFFALLGPSGCGKTTLLRLIAGLESVDAGKIFLGNIDITHQPVHKREINVIFQNYALFPHMNVFDNIAYGLFIQKKSSKEIYDKVHKLLKTFHLEDQIHKKPSELSGGQQQRVAIARAIIKEPQVLLLDEPLAALDLKLKEELLVELIELQDKLHTTFVYVTHDQSEALTVADHMVIFNHKGNVAQIGTPKQIYEFPNSPFVAQFVGKTNVFLGYLLCINQNYKFSVPDLGEFAIASPHEKFIHNQEAIMSVRPEKIFISKEPVANFSNTLQGIVISIVYTGRSTLYEVALQNGMKLQVFEQNEEHFPQENIDYDDAVYLCWQKENALLLEI